MFKKVGALIFLSLFFSCSQAVQNTQAPIVFPSFTTGVFSEKSYCERKKEEFTGYPKWFNRVVTLNMKEEMKFSEVLYALKSGNVIFEDGTDEKVRIPFYRGTIGNLIRAYAESRGYCLSFVGDTAVIRKDCVKSVSVPDWITEKDLKKLLTVKGLSYAYDPVKKVVILKGKKRIVNTALKVLKETTSTKINLRIFVGELTTKKSRERGINWEKVLGEYVSSYSEANSEINSSSAGQPKTDVKVSFQNGVSSFTLKTPHFNLQGLVGILSKYARIKILQNVLISSGNGEEQEVVAGDRVPYVKEIGTTVIGQSSATQAVQTVTFGEVNSGIKVKVKPFYDKEKGVLRLKLTVDNASILGYVNLKSGEYEVSRPIVSERKVKTTLSFSPDEVVVLTTLGKTEEKFSGNSLSGKFPYRREDREKSSLFIIVGAEVVRYECR